MKNNIYILVTFLAFLIPFSLAALDNSNYDSLDAFMKGFAKKHQLELINKTGCGAGLHSIWGVSVASEQNMTLDEGRKLASELAYNLLYKMYHEPSFTKYCTEWHKKCPNPINDNMTFRIAYWDKNVNRPLYPYLAQIRMEEGKLFFHYADPKTQALQEPIVETLESLNLPNYR